jgi:uncharacterized membrane protein YphA (DoxX/SURF4 family)
MRKQFDPTADLVCRLLLAGIFIYAALIKIDSPRQLADSIASYGLVPASLIDLLALGLPLFEFACGVLLLTGFGRGVGLVGAITMLIVFLGAISSEILRGHPVDCGCFGPDSAFDARPDIAAARDVLLLLLAVYAYAHHLRRGAPPASAKFKFAGRAPIADQNSTRISAG